MAVVAGEQTRGQTRFGHFDANLIAAGYQFGFLILPTLLPVLVDHDERDARLRKLRPAQVQP